MATIRELKTQIENANALGRTNLSEKGVELPAGATTYDIMTAIAEIVSGGGGIEYTSIVYNTDNTITLTDKDGVIHTMSCTYDNGKLIGATYDGKAVDLTYNGAALIKVGKTSVDVANVPSSSFKPLDNTVTFTVDGKPYEIVSVKAGNSVNIPVSIKDSNGFLYKWTLNGEEIKFPYTPTESVILEGTPLGSLVSPDINEWRKNTVAQEAYIAIKFNGNENTVSYKGVGGYEYIYYPVSFKANRRYVFSITFKTKNLSYSTYSQPYSPFISVSKNISTSTNVSQYSSALVSTVMNSTPDTEYATYSLTYESFEAFEGYAVFDTGNITDEMNGMLYIKDISLYAADLTSNG